MNRRPLFASKYLHKKEVERARAAHDARVATTKATCETNAAKKCVAASRERDVW